VREETGGSEGHESAVDPAPQAREQPQRHVVRDQPLEVAQDPPREAEEAHADDRHPQGGDRRMKRRLREQPRRRPHETDAGAERQHLEHDRERDAAALGDSEADKASDHAVPPHAATSRG
jgi:hypothetical protein